VSLAVQSHECYSPPVLYDQRCVEATEGAMTKGTL
jgi:hypothetical protein